MVFFVGGLCASPLRYAPLPASPAGMRGTPVVHRGARTRERVERGGLDAEW